jgi:hypothetical protein
MRLLAYILLFLFISILIIVTFFGSFFDNEIKYLRYSDEELEIMFEEAIQEKQDKKAKDLYEQLDLRDRLCDEKRRMMEMYLNKYQ